MATGKSPELDPDSDLGAKILDPDPAKSSRSRSGKNVRIRLDPDLTGSGSAALPDSGTHDTVFY
jgi:hypothetical protein